MEKINESDIVNAQIAGNEMLENENSLLKAAIKLVLAAGYDVVRKGDKPETHHIAETKDAVVESAKNVGSLFKGLGKITLEKVSAMGTGIKEGANDLIKKGQEETKA